MEEQRKRDRARERKRKQRDTASEETKAKEKESDRLRKKRCIQGESSGDRQTRLYNLRRRAQQRRLTETAEQRDERLKDLRERAQQRCLTETVEQRDERLKDLQERAQQRRLAETVEQRDERLENLREHAQQRCSTETVEQRDERLEDLRERAQQRCLTETVEQRDERLKDLQERAQQRRLGETVEQRDERLENLREHAQQRRSTETVEQRDERLEDLRKLAQQRRSTETDEQRELRLQHEREASSCRRQERQQQQQITAMTKNHYLHEGGWAESQEQLHQQSWAQQEMMSFHEKQNRWEHRLCTVCHELWPTRTCLKDCPDTFICTRCKRDKHPIKKFSAANDMDPGFVPPCLRQLSQVEEMLIARACPIMLVYRKHGGQRGYKGHVLNMPQDVQGFLDRLPCEVSQLPVLVVRRHGTENTHADFRVRRGKVMEALQWLQQNNRFYQDIMIDHAALQNLPEDGVPLDLLTFEEDGAEADSDNDDDAQSECTGDSHSFLPLPSREATEDSAIRSIVNGDNPVDWPDIAGQPINEFRTPGLASQAFPTLFPYGSGDPTYPGRQREVSLTEGFKHLIKYGEKTASNNLHWRFANHPRFPYWALNMKLRHQLLSQAKVYLHHNPGDANLTVEELRAMVGNLSSEHLMKRLQRYAAKVQGSNQYWFQRHQELRALLDQKGPPTFFWTVSSADTYWPELHNLMMHPPGTQPTHQMRVQAVINNPHITDWYFASKLSDWIDHWLYKTLDAEWHWCRYEYQARGSTHAHGCAKLKNDPGVCSLVEKAAVGWLASNRRQDGTDVDDDERLIQEGEVAKTAALEYADWLVTTMNNSIPDETWHVPVPHPCTLNVMDLGDTDDSDYHDIVNTVQRHTRCSPAYCLRRKPGQQEQKCRFDYPRPQQQASTLEFERLPDGTVRASLTTKRNDPRLNTHNRLMIQHWCANVDLQIIVDVDACARYMAKYATKGEPRSQAVSSIFKSSVDHLSDNGDAHKVLRSAMVRSVGERDFSAQETAHQLLSLPLVSCSYTFVALSLDGGRPLRKDEHSGEHVLDLSLLDHYAARSTLPDVNLIEFVSKYSIYCSEPHKRPSPVIVRTFPQYPSNPRSEQYGRYCKYQLIKYKPWKGKPSNAWGDLPDTDVMCIEAYHSFLRTPAAATYIPQFAHELDRAQQHLAESETSDNENEDPTQTEEHEDWMLLCRLNHCYANDTTLQHDSIDWGEPARAFPPETLRECPTWIKTKRKEADDDSHSPWHRQLPSVDVNTLNVEQKTAYDIICRHHEQFTAGNTPPPLHMIVCGTAGTGKSYLISAIAHALGSMCVLTGTTGMAAFHICGKTLHSALQLPIHSSSHRELQGSALHRLQLAMKDKSYVIIDEMSMMGLRMMAWVDKRLRQATGQMDVPFGGMSVILFGDFGQLPPVGDRPLYCNAPAGSLGEHGHAIYQLFTTVVILSQALRQAGSDSGALAFRSFLLRLRDGTVNHDDWQMLLERTPQQAKNCDDFTDAIRLFYDKVSVAEYNFQKLHSLHTPVARLNAIHSDSAASSANPDDAGGLHPVIFLATQARVMLTTNIWQEVGLCNGAAGTVHQLLYQANHKPPDLPIAVLVDFDNYAGPPFLSSRPNCVPVPPLSFEWESNGRRLSRQQVPLQLCYAITIHKSQGQTLEKAVIDIGKAELAAGCTFVAVSRLRSLNHGLIQPMSFQRLQAISTGKRLAERLEEETRLKHLATLTVPSHLT